MVLYSGVLVEGVVWCIVLYGCRAVNIYAASTWGNNCGVDLFKEHISFSWLI